MKQLIPLILPAFLLGCSSPSRMYEAQPLIMDSNAEFINSTMERVVVTKEIFQQFIPDDNLKSNKSEEAMMGFSKDELKPLGDSVDLYRELIEIFNPDQFDCGYDEKLKRKLQKHKPRNRSDQEEGFIPKVVTDNAFYSEKAIKIQWRAGSNILAHGFFFRKQDGNFSKYLFARSSPTVKNFNEMDYFELNRGTYPFFMYTLDCSGYLSIAVDVTLGVQKNSLKASASRAANNDRSLMVVGGLMYSPLYQAFKGEGLFKSEDKKTLEVRIGILNAILNEIPQTEMFDTTQVFLNSNYLVLFASNKGSASFNGKANISLSGGISFLARNISGGADVGAKIQRSSTFTDYNTYFVEANVQTEVERITISKIKELVKELKRVVDNDISINSNQQ